MPEYNGLDSCLPKDLEQILIGRVSDESALKSYIGAKIVQGKPMTRGEFREKVEQVAESHYCSPEDDGYLVIYEDGYKSWSPKALFERCYRELIPSEKALIK